MASNSPQTEELIWDEYLHGQEDQLPPIQDVQKLTETVIRITGGNPSVAHLQGTNTYLVGTGKSRILIDTGEGMPSWINKLTKFLRERDLDLSHILLTHWHGDHTGGVPDLISYEPSFRNRIYKNQPDRGQHDIEDGQIFRTEGATLRAVYTPGHAIDHMCFVLEEENALFTGDNVLGHGYSVFEDLGTYMKSLRLMADQNCALGYPAHGDKIFDLPRRMKLYIQQKTMRERRIYEAFTTHKSKEVKHGKNGKVSLTVRELVFTLHGDVPEDTLEMALEPVSIQVLWKLAEDKKMGFYIDGGLKRWFLNEPMWA